MTDEATDTAAHDVEGVLEKLEGPTPTKVIGKGRHGDTIIDDDRDAIEQERREAASLIRQLRDERDALKETLETVQNNLSVTFDDQVRYLDNWKRAEARVAELEKALGPFAKIGGYMRFTPGAHTVTISYRAVEADGIGSHGRALAEVADFHAARTARAVKGDSDAGN